jgi:hypothetical protein
MEKWVKAINQKGLFTEGAEEEGVTAKASSLTKPPPGRRRRVEEQEDEEEDERTTRRKERKRQQQRTKMATGVKVGLIVGGILLLFVLVLCAGGVVAVIYLIGRGGAGGDRSFTVSNLAPGRSEDRFFTFQQGKRIIITSTNTLTFPNTDVDLHVFRGNALLPMAVDTRLPREDPNCRVEFVAPATDTYRIRVVNLGPGMARTCQVRIEER